MKNYYDVLGLERTAEPDRIKRAFRDLAIRYHPDINHTPEAQVRMREINDAYSILGNPEERRKYDASFSTTFSETAPDSSYTYSGAYQSHNFSTVDLWGDLFENVGTYVRYSDDDSKAGERMRTEAAAHAIGDGMVLIAEWLISEFNKKQGGEHGR